VSYIEGFIAAVPAVNKEKYRDHAQKAWPVFQQLGATRMMECWGDDVPKGESTDFFRAVKATDDEVVVFSWVVYPDKATRDSANEKMMNDPQLSEQMGDMPFDGKRLVYGGFEPIFDSDR